MKKVLIVSFSGGRTSAYMAYKIQNSAEYQDFEKVYVFANTGKEREETLEFVNECDQRWNLGMFWIEADINPEKGVGTSFTLVDFETANRTGKPFEDSIRKYGIPSQHNPHCSRDLKTNPIEKFAKRLFKEYQMAIGYRMDETQRINPKTAKQRKFVFPLVDVWPTWNIQVRRFWDAMPFDLQLKDYQGNCDLCWKKSQRNRLTILSENPAIGDQWQRWEEESDFIFDRDGIPVSELQKIAQHAKFRRSIDRFELAEITPTLFSNLDSAAVCMCNNEVEV